ncbi:hypothetical protein B0J18DRAFT_282636 [Chaetomium sp. MPI-SDFR-AT-0129]|nr:hypothetical protein B0J18DRAFT_282636 [Chaetomium sp. MPI-SDFR-AT-0129]
MCIRLIFICPRCFFRSGQWRIERFESHGKNCAVLQKFQKLMEPDHFKRWSCVNKECGYSEDGKEKIAQKIVEVEVDQMIRQTRRDTANTIKNRPEESPDFEGFERESTVPLSGDDESGQSGGIDEDEEMADADPEEEEEEEEEEEGEVEDFVTHRDRLVAEIALRGQADVPTRWPRWFEEEDELLTLLRQHGTPINVIPNFLTRHSKNGCDTRWTKIRRRGIAGR